MNIELLNLRFRRLSLKLKGEVRRTFKVSEEVAEGMGGMSYEDALSPELEPFIETWAEVDTQTAEQFRRQLLEDAPAVLDTAAYQEDTSPPMKSESWSSSDLSFLRDQSLKKYEVLMLAALTLSPSGQPDRPLTRGMIMKLLKAAECHVNSVGSLLRHLREKPQPYLRTETGSERFFLTALGRAEAEILHPLYAYAAKKESSNLTSPVTT